MAQIGSRGIVKNEITVVLSEEEAGALDALAGYGTDNFLDTFYAKMGRAYLEPYEAGLRSLFDSVHTGSCSVQYFLRRAQDARDVMDGTKKAV